MLGTRVILDKYAEMKILFCLKTMCILFLVLTACSSLATSKEISTSHVSTTITHRESPSDKEGSPATSLATVTGQAEGAPTGCSVQEVTQQLQNFAVAFNDDQQRLSTMFSDHAPFAWYSAPEGDSTSHAIYTVEELPEYFEQRHAQHEQLEFKRIQVNGWEAGHDLVHFEFNVSRRADDLNSGQARQVIGKGAFHCETQTFVAISIGDG